MLDAQPLNEALEIVSAANNGFYSPIIHPTECHLNALTELHIANQDRTIGRVLENPDFDLSFNLKNAAFELPTDKLLMPGELKFTNDSAKRGYIRSLSWGNQASWTIDQILTTAYNDKNDLTDRQKIQALWLYGKRSQIHSAPTGNWDATENLDPIIHLNAYGYGTCGHNAHMIAGLLALAGFTARVRNIQGAHTFPEVLVNENWLVFDVNGETWYRDQEGDGDPLSFEKLQNRSNEFWRAQHLRPLARNKNKYALWDKFGDPSASKIVYEITPKDALDNFSNSISMPVEPYETIAFLPLNKSPWQVQGNIALWPENWAAPSPVRTLACSRQWVDLKLEELKEQQGQSLSIKIPKRPFPVMDIEINVHLNQRAATHPSIIIFDPSKNRQNLHFSPVSNSKNKCHYCFRLRRGFIENPDLSNVEFQIALDIDDNSIVKSIDITEHRQFSSLTFPAVIRGALSFETDLGEPLRAEISFCATGWAPHNNSSLMAIEIKSNQTDLFDRDDDLAFSWKFPFIPDADSLIPADNFKSAPHVIRNKSRLSNKKPIEIQFEFILENKDIAFSMPSPLFHKYLSSTTVLLSKSELELLIPGRKYNWRVRLVDANKRPISAWSNREEISISKNSDAVA